MTDKEKCPFEVGDEVTFIGGEKLGWFQNLDTFGLKIDDVITINKINEEKYIYDSSGNGGWHWRLFKKC